MTAQRPEYFITPALLLLVGLADQVPRHGYLLADELIDLTGWRPSPSTVSDTLARLDRDGLIEEVPNRSRRRPYRITDYGLDELDGALGLMNRVVRRGRTALREWRRAEGRTGELVDRRRATVFSDVPDDLRARLDEAAAASGLSKAAIVTEALSRRLAPGRPRGECTVCHRDCALTNSGNIWAHTNPETEQLCNGAGKPPVDPAPETQGP